MKVLMQKNRQLQRQARELRSAHSRVEKLEEQVATMQQELRNSAQNGGCDSAALEQEHTELCRLVSESQAAASAALQEMANVELRVMRAIRGESEEPEADDTEHGSGTHGEGATNSSKWGTAGAGGSRRSMQNDCVASVSSWSEREAYALSGDTGSTTGESDYRKSISPGVLDSRSLPWAAAGGVVASGVVGAGRRDVAGTKMANGGGDGGVRWESGRWKEALMKSERQRGKGGGE